MHHPRRAQIANRIHLALMRELGQGIDLKKMLHNALYARDVLLVCQAYPGSELQQLGRQFVQVTRDEAQSDASRPSGWQRDSSGFGQSRPAASGGFSDFDALVETGHGAHLASRRWLAPSTWFAR